MTNSSKIEFQNKIFRKTFNADVAGETIDEIPEVLFIKKEKGLLREDDGPAV